MNQEIIKLWGEYKKECQNKIEELECVDEKVKAKIEKLMYDWGGDEYTPFIGNPRDQIMLQNNKYFDSLKSKFTPTFEGFMEWLEANKKLSKD